MSTLQSLGAADRDLSGIKAAALVRSDEGGTVSARVWIGLDRRSGEDVCEPIGHLAVFGQTRRAGKTTSLRELVARACAEVDAQALIFRTGTGEIAFDAYPSTPFFRERLSWQAVESMLWTFLNERPKVYRPIIMKAVRAARSLDEVHRNIVAAGRKSKVGWVVDRTYELDTYFQEILPWLREHELATTVRLARAESVVDLEGWPRTVQQLVVAATLDSLMDAGKRVRPLIVVLPEARTFVPSDSKTPVTRAADRLAREGAKLNLFLWIDSQALTGVDQQVLRNFAIQLQGVQTSDLELSRVSKAFEVPAKEIRSLKVGDFILHTDDGVRTVHVPLVEPKEEAKVDEKERKQYEDRIAKLEEGLNLLETTNAEQAAEIHRLKTETRSEHDRAEANARAAAANAVESIEGRAAVVGALRDLVEDPGRMAALNEDTRKVLAGAERAKADLHVWTETPDLTVHVRVVRLEAKPDSVQGRVAMLIADGFLDRGQKQVEIAKELVARGAPDYRVNGGSRARLYEALLELAGQGFLRRSGPDWKVIPEAKARVRVLREAA